MDGIFSGNLARDFGPAYADLGVGAGRLRVDVGERAGPIDRGCAGGGVVFEANTDAHVITDVSGAFTPTGDGLDPVGPLRVLDTRSVPS